MASISPGFTPAMSIALRLACSPSSVPVSPSVIQRRSCIPVRVRIHSSVVSMSSDSSWLVTTRSGTAKPVPRKRVRCIGLPGVGRLWQGAYVALPKGESQGTSSEPTPDPEQPCEGKDPSHSPPCFPDHSERSEPCRPPGVGTQSVALDDADCAEAGAKLPKDHRAYVGRALRSRTHQIPYHAGGTPAMAVTDSCHKCVVS